MNHFSLRQGIVRHKVYERKRNMLQEILDIPDVVCIRDSLYAKTPAALERLLEVLRGIGYQVKNIRERCAERPNERPTLEERIQGQHCLWYVSLDISQGKCGTCKEYIDRTGILSDDHRCERCGSVTYLEFFDGVQVRFAFNVLDGEAYCPIDLTLKVQRWDRDQEWMYFYPEILKGSWTVSQSDLEAYFRANKHKWEEVEEDGQKLVRIRFLRNYDQNTAVIRLAEVTGSYTNARIVNVWKGREYNEMFDEDLPVAMGISIYEAWHWAPLPASPTLYEWVCRAANKVSRRGYYHEDGSPEFSHEDFARMGIFVRHCTALDADEWDKRSRTFRLDAIGAIADIRHFCDPTFVLPPVPKRTRAAGHGWMVINYDLKDPAKE